MTRRERRGTIVVLVIIALLLGLTVAVRSCRDSSVVETTELQRFRTEVDSVTPPEKKPGANTAPATPKRAPRHKKQPKHDKPKAPTQPRPIDPLPQF